MIKIFLISNVIERFLSIRRLKTTKEALVKNSRLYTYVLIDEICSWGIMNKHIWERDCLKYILKS